MVNKIPIKSVTSASDFPYLASITALADSEGIFSHPEAYLIKKRN